MAYIMVLNSIRGMNLHKRYQTLFCAENCPGEGEGGTEQIISKSTSLILDAHFFFSALGGVSFHLEMFNCSAITALFDFEISWAILTYEIICPLLNRIHFQLL